MITKPMRFVSLATRFLASLMPDKWKKQKKLKGSIPGIYVPTVPVQEHVPPLMAEAVAKCPYRDCLEQLAIPGKHGYGRVKGMLVVPDDYDTRCVYPEDAGYISTLLKSGNAITLKFLHHPAIIFTY
jgi:hypothetical protein